MSYILDALRKAEAERERGHVPGIHAQQSVTGAAPAAEVPRATRWIGLGAIVLAAVLIGAGLVWWRLGAAPPPVALATTNPAALPMPSSMPMATPTPVPATVSGSPNQATSANTGPPAGTTPPLPATAPAPEPARAPKTNAGATPADVARLAAARASAAARLSASPTTANGSALNARPANAEPATMAPQGAQPADGGDGPLPGKVYAISELPEAVRSQLPTLAVGGSMYSPNRTSRILVVNGQVAQEGSQIAPGVVLEQIRVKSAVLQFRGYRYSLPF